MPRAGFSPGIATHCPHPSGAGEEAGGRAGWGLRGGIYEFRRLRGGGEPPPRSPPPEAIVTTVHCPGEPGDTPRSPSTLRRVGMNTRTNTGVQQSLNLADSQPGTQCTHGCVRADGGTPSPGPSPARAYTRWRAVPALVTRDIAHFCANVRQHALNPVDIRSQGTFRMCSPLN